MCPPGPSRLGPTSTSPASTVSAARGTPQSPRPAVAGGYRVPDPIGDFEAYLPYVVLAEVLTDGDASRLVERLVQRDRTATTIGGYIGFMGDEYQVRNPTAKPLQAQMPPGGDGDKVVRTID